MFLIICHFTEIYMSNSKGNRQRIAKQLIPSSTVTSASAKESEGDPTPAPAKQAPLEKETGGEVPEGYYIDYYDGQMKQIPSFMNTPASIVKQRHAATSGSMVNQGQSFDEGDANKPADVTPSASLSTVPEKKDVTKAEAVVKSIFQGNPGINIETLQIYMS